MPLTSQPTKTDGSIGRVKSDTRPILTSELDTVAPAAEYERIKTGLIDVSDEVGNHAGAGGSLNTRVTALEAATVTQQEAFDSGRTIVTTVAKGALAISSTEDTTVLALTENTAAAAQPIATIASSATDRTGALLKLTTAGAEPGLEVATGGGSTALKITPGSADPTLLTDRRLQFTGSIGATVIVADKSASLSPDLTLKSGGNATGNAGTINVQAGSSTGGNGNGGDVNVVPGEKNGAGANGLVNIATTVATTTTIGHDSTSICDVVGNLDVSADVLIHGNAEALATLQVDGSFFSGADAEFNSTVDMTGVITPSAISGTTTDWDPTSLGNCSVVNVALSGSGAEIVSIMQAVNGKLLILHNIDTALTCVLRSDDGATGTAANRLLLPNNKLGIPPDGTALLRYDGSTSNRWRLVGGTNLIPQARSVSGTSDTPTVADNGTTIVFTSGSAITVTIGTMPANTRIEFYQDGAGQITLSGSGVTLRIDALYLAKTRAQFGIIGVYFVDSTHAVIYGDLALA